MNRKFSIYVGQFQGIRVYIHWTFWIILVWIFFMYYNLDQDVWAGLQGVLYILALFACVVLHEFGHALTAKRYNILTRGITLYPIGGVANLESMPEKPRQELMVALAGPLVNVVIALILWAYLQFSGQMPDLSVLQDGAGMMSLPFIYKIFIANIILVAFNLIPAFPMDGGRILRALLALNMHRTKATQIAATIGQVLAIIFVFFGFFYSFWLVVIGLFIYIGAGSEANYENIRSELADYKVKDVVMRRFSHLQPDDTLGRAVEMLLNGQEQEFLVIEGGQVMGILTRKELIRGLAEFGKSSPVSKAMSKEYVTLNPDMALQDVYHQMTAKKCSVSPVLENGKFIGVVDKTNIDELLMVKSAVDTFKKES